MVKQLEGTSVWDHVRHILAGKLSQNMTPLAQQIIKNPPGKACCPQNISSHYMFTMQLKYYLSNTYTDM